ncbi:hypothetical protein ABC977_17610 [Thioalkalicoccus limnaeus]|uniref:Uncharacterized protein n=1 Tax=Thioalkalicoccus limnaeus TaxID=120681 RepID=A0ABV4BLS5_9GAMM
MTTEAERQLAQAQQALEVARAEEAAADQLAPTAIDIHGAGMATIYTPRLCASACLS